MNARGEHSAALVVPLTSQLSDAAFTPIIRSRLAPPRISGAVVQREGILPTLARGAPLTLIVGPAGSGKTLLCASWRKQLVATGHAVAWFNLGPEDDESQFVAYLAAAFETVGLALPARPHDLGARAVAPTSMRLFLAELVNGLHRDERPIVLMLEDFHFVRHHAIVDFIDSLVELAPPHFRLAISSRTRPALNLLQLRVRDQLTEIGFGELRFTLDEAKQFLRHQRVEDLSATQLHTLHQLTDGWAAGLQLAAMSLRKAPDAQAYLQRFALTLTPSREHSLHDYLQECVAEHFDDTELDFLVRTSVCRRFNRELCAQLTGHPQAAQLLARFEADNLFVIPIEFDDTLPWYRFHRLLAAYLNERLAAMPGQEVATLHDSASRWFAQRGLYPEAIHHALAAGNVDLQIELVERAARPTLNGAGLVQLLKWFEQVPRDRARDCGELLRCVGWAQVMAGALDDFDWSIAALEAHTSAQQADVALEIKLLKAFRRLRLDDTASALELLAPYLGQTLQARPFDQMLLCNLLAYALIGDDRFELARDLVRDRPQRACVQQGPRVRRPTPFVDAVVGISFLAQGDMQQARLALARTLDEARRLGVDPSAYVACYLAEAHYQVDELQDAEALLDEFDSVVDLVGMADSLLHAYRVRARLCAARGDVDAALRVLDRMESLARRHGADRLAAQGLALRVRFEAARRQWPSAREALRRLDALAQRHLGDGHGALADIGRLLEVARAELALATDQPEQAWQLLEPLIADRERRGRLGEATMLRLLAADAQSKRGQHAQALFLVGQALSEAHERRMVRVFIDAGAATAGLLQEWVNGADPAAVDVAFAREVLRRLAAIAGGHAPFSDTASSEGPTRAGPSLARTVETLSLRETEILGLLAQALSTKSIARVLDVSAGTVKWHLKNVYAKLGVVSREQAVLKGRGLGLIA